MTEVSVGDDTSDLPTRRFASTAKKRINTDSHTNEYFVQPEGLVVGSAVQVEVSMNETSTYDGESTAATPIPTGTFFHTQSVGSPPTTSGMRDGVLNNSIADSLASFVSELSRTRRRRRREQLALENPVEGARQRQELEKALQNLEEMQRENKERMLRVGSQVFSSKTQSPNERGAGSAQRAPPMFFRTQSVGGKLLPDGPKYTSLERAMTSSVIPEPNVVTPAHGSRQRYKNSPNDGKSHPPRRSQVSPPHVKKGEAFTNVEHRASTTLSNAREKSQSARSPRVSIARKADSSSEKKSPSLRMSTLAASKGVMEPPSSMDRVSVTRSMNGGEGEEGGGKVDATGMYMYSNTLVNMEDVNLSLLSHEEKKNTKTTPNRGKRIGNGRPFVRPGGRSVSPPIIILTVDSRKNMGEEDARRLLSAEPVRMQDHHARRLLHGSEGCHSRTAGNAKSTSEKSQLRSPASKERPSMSEAPNSGKEKEKTMGETETKKIRNPSVTKIPVMNSPVSPAVPPTPTPMPTPSHAPPPPSSSASVPVPVFVTLSSSAAHITTITTNTATGSGNTTMITATGSKKKNDGGRVEVDSTHDAPNHPPPQTKTRSSTDVQVISYGTKKKKHSSNEGSATNTLTSKTRTGRNSTTSSKAATTVVNVPSTSGNVSTAPTPSHAATERKMNVQLQQERRSGTLEREPSNVLSLSTVSRRRIGGTSSRAAATRREDSLLTHEKEGYRGTKSTSPPNPSEGSPNASQHPNWQYISWRRKSLSAITHTNALDRDAFRPLATDRPTVTRTRVAKRTPIGEPLSTKQLVPFCTECGKRHIDEKVKFCAFCGHKRETV
ncbi:hypothetical protein LSM04_002032 [Trypanosoma melophagium]|uniref:uncharacterized protein n=1 Tax=Trypanosoma melophagium TaxID=715481 RepID=UPI00351A6702|nr:hypothetical protein LSM04_002032 [Trypanosoma melophagium]